MEEGEKDLKRKPKLKKSEKWLLWLFIFGGVAFIYFSIVISAEKRGEERALEAIAEAQASESITEEENAEWYLAWDDLQGGEVQEEQLWRIKQNWEAYEKSGCDPYWIASLHWRETGFDVNNNNPFQLPKSMISPDQTFNGLIEDAKTACRFLQRGGELPPINKETIGLWAEASFRYNGTAYESWEQSPYVVNNLDSKHINMRKCATDGCGTTTTDYLDGVMTFYLKILDKHE